MDEAMYRKLTWERLRGVGELRMLRISYLLLIAVPLAIPTIHFVNSTAASILSIARHSNSGNIVDLSESGPIYISTKITLLYASSILISLGHLIYKIGCPSQLQFLPANEQSSELQVFGNKLYWCTSLLRKGYDDGTKDSCRNDERFLTEAIIEGKHNDNTVAQGSPAYWVLSRWAKLQYESPILRITCFLS